jgi:glycosyltransferase involved in cell wall biosynthesis
VGGAERVISRLTQILKKQGHDVYTMLSDAQGAAYHLEGTVIDFGVPKGKTFFQKCIVLLLRIKNVKRYKRDYSFDVTISFLDGSNLVNILTRKEPGKTFASIRNHLSSEIVNTPRFYRAFYIWGYSRLYRKADGVISVSRAIARDMEVTFHIPPNKSSVLYNPYDSQDIITESKSSPSEDYIAFCSNKDKIICSIGRMQYQKGYWHLLKIFSVLAKRNPNIGLLIIGTGEQEGKIHELAKTLCIQDNIYFAGYQKNPFSYMKYCSAYVLSSLFEGFPNAMVEAMGLGLPIIAADCQTGPREILAPELSIDSLTVDTSYAASYGILMPPLVSDEDWGPQVYVEEIFWADTIGNFLDNESSLLNYKVKSITRFNAFSYDACFQALMQILESTDGSAES